LSVSKHCKIIWSISHFPVFFPVFKFQVSTIYTILSLLINLLYYMINTFSSLHSVSSLHTEHAALCNMFFSLSSALSILQPRTVPSIIPPSPSDLCSSTVAVLCIVVYCYVRLNSTLISNCLVVLKNTGLFDLCVVCSLVS